MELIQKSLSIRVGTKGITSEFWNLPWRNTKRIALIVAHGAGNDMDTPLITSFTRGLAALGFPVLRFNFHTEYHKKDPR